MNWKKALLLQASRKTQSLAGSLGPLQDPAIVGRKHIMCFSRDPKSLIL